MPRRKASDSIANVLSLAEGLRNRITALPAEIRDGTKDLALAIVTRTGKRRGRPPGKRGRPRGRRGRPPGRWGRRPGRPRKVGRPPKAAPATA
jgi:hypothetical protein